MALCYDIQYMSRYFHLMHNDIQVGRFQGKNPKQAASKSFTALYRNNRWRQNIYKENEPINFTIVESTRGSKHKQFKYVGIRKKLNVPVNIKIGHGVDSQTITHNYRNYIKADKKQYIDQINVPK